MNLPRCDAATRMVVSPIPISATAGRETFQQTPCGDSVGLKEGPGRDSGIVEGWGGDEDEDVNIDSDEKDSRSEGLLAVTENRDLVCVPTGGSTTHLLDCSGMDERTESSAARPRYEDPTRSNERAVTGSKVSSPNLALKDNGSGVLTRKNEVGSVHGDNAENGKNSTDGEGIRVGSSWPGSTVAGGTKRLDARRFRRDFNVKVNGVLTKSKVVVSDADQTRGCITSDAEEEKLQPKEIDVAAAKTKMKMPNTFHTPTMVRKGAGDLARDNNSKGKRTSGEEVAVLQRKRTDRMVSGGDQTSKDSCKKRRFNDQDYAQACERKSSLRVRGELSKNSDSKMRRETRGHIDARSPTRSNHARKVYQGGTTVSEKRAPSKRALEMRNKSLPALSTIAGTQNSTVDNQKPLQVKENLSTPCIKQQNSRHSLSEGGAKKSDLGLAKRMSELDSLEKVVERRATKMKDKVTGTGDNPESTRVIGESTISRQPSNDFVPVGKTFDQKTGEKESGKPADKGPKRSTGRSCGGKESQQSTSSGFGSDESQDCTSKQGNEGERGGLNLRQRPSKSLEKGTEDTETGLVPLRTKHTTARRSVTDSENTDKYVINFSVGMPLFLPGSSGSALQMDVAGEIAVGQEENLHGKRKRSQQAERILQNGGSGQEFDFEPKDGSEGEIPVVDQHPEAKKQRLTDGKFIAVPVSTADVDVPVVSAQSKEVLPNAIYGGSNEGRKEVEIQRSLCAGEKEVPKVTKSDVLREGLGETRLGENDQTHEDRKSRTLPFVPVNEPSLSKIKLNPGQIQAAVEMVENNESTHDEVKGAVCPFDIECHVGPDASTLGSEEKLERVTVAGAGKPQKGNACSAFSNHEYGCVSRSVEAEDQIHELCVSEHSSTSSHDGREMDKRGESKSDMALLAVSDLNGEDGSDSDDGKTSDHHNSYCEHCRNGGKLLCCDGSGCKITYHLECTDPKLGEVPSGDWYCPMCAHKRLSYGVHAVSKSVESIWDVRNCAQSLGKSSSLPKDGSAIDLPGCTEEDPGTTKRSLGCTRRMHVTNKDKGEDECIAAVTVVVDDEEGIDEIGGNQGTTQGGDEDCSVQTLTEQRPGDLDVKTSEKTKMTKAKFSSISSRATQDPKLVDDSRDKEYFVKWRGISHAHNTWVAESELVKLSPKGLARFKKKVSEGQIVQWISDWAEPQRLVDRRVSIPPRRPGGGRGRGFLGMDTQYEWFVKWKGLGYEHCTWEPAHSGVLLDVKVKQLEMMFDKWTEAAKQRNDPERVVEVDKLRDASYKQLQSDVEWIRSGTLLPYQLDRVNQLRQRWHHHHNTIVMDQVDQQEKSAMTVTFLLSLIEEYGIYRMILLIVPAFEISYWEAEIAENAPQVNTVVYMGSKEARGVIQRYELNNMKAPLKVQVVLTTCDIAYSDFEYLRKHKWEVVVVDESHQSKTAKSHRAFLQFDTQFWLLFVSELSKYNVEELQEMLYLFQPQSSLLTSTIRKELTGLDEIGQLQLLKDQLNEHTIRDSVPESGLKLVECWVGSDMTPLQIQLYCTTLTKHYNLLESGRLRSDPDSPSLHDVVNLLRLCCQHPYLVDPTLDPTMQKGGKQDLPASQSPIDAGVQASEKWQLLHAMLSVLHKHHRVVILSQCLMQLYFLDDYLRLKYGADSYELVDTRHSAHRKHSAVQRFNAKDSSRSFILLRTGAAGFSLKLKDKDVVVIHDSDLNPVNDLEYLRKVLHRVDGELKVFRLYQRFTVEEASMVYDRQKKLGADAKPPSVKFLQQLLRWNVQHILELDSSFSHNSDLPKGKSNFDLEGKASRDMKRVRKILQGDLEMKAATETPVYEVWNEEDGDPVKGFWFSLLKDRYAELQDRQEQSTPGKVLRQRKRVQYSEDALAQAPYSAPEEEEFRRKRRRPQLVESTSILVNQQRETDSSLPQLPSTPKQTEDCQDQEAPGDVNFSSRHVPEVERGVTSEVAVSLAVPVADQIADEQNLEHVGSDGMCDQNNQEVEPKPSSEAIPSSAKKVKREELLGHATTEVVRVEKFPKPSAVGTISSTALQVDSAKRLRMEQKQQLFKMRPELSRIVDILQVEERIAGYAQQILAHVMNNYRMPKEPRELVVMVEISLCLIACAHFRQVMEPLSAVSRVGEKMKLALKKEEFASVYSRLEGMCKTYVARSLAQQEVGDEERFLDEAAQSNRLSQPISSGSEYPVQLPPSLQVPESSSPTKSNLSPSGGQQPRVDQISALQSSVIPVNKAAVSRFEQDDSLGTGLEQSQQPVQAEDCEVTGCQIGDKIVGQATSPHNLELNASLEHTRGQLRTVPSEVVEPRVVEAGEAIRARLKADRNELLRSWLVKQKLEVQLFNACCARESDAYQKSFQKQKAEILTSGNLEQGHELLRQVGDLSASTIKLLEREGEDRRQELNIKQRDIRNRIHALHTKLLQMIITGRLPDFVSEAKRMGLACSMQSQPPRLLEHGRPHSKQSLQVAQQTGHISRPGQNTDLRSLATTLEATVEPHPQFQTQPQAREEAPAASLNSQLPSTQLQSPSHSHLLPEVQIQSLAHLQSSEVTACSQPSSLPGLFNPDEDVSTREEPVAAQLQYPHPPPQRSQIYDLQQNAQTNSRSQPSRSHPNVVEASLGATGSQPIIVISTQELETTHSAVEQASVNRLPQTEHGRVSEMLTGTTGQQSMLSQALQTATIFPSRSSQTSQVPVNLQPRVTQNSQSLTSPQGRILQNVQASPSIQTRGPQEVGTPPPQGSETVETPTSLQPRVSQSRRSLSTQHAGRHAFSLHHTAAPQVRVQTHLQPSPFLSATGTFLTTQTRSNVHSPSTSPGEHSSQSALGPDPLVHEENRLRLQQEKVRLLYNEETAQIRAQFDREVTEVQRKYESLLFERTRTFEQKAAALKDNLDKVDRNRQLAEALKLRSMLDQQKARQTPGHSPEIVVGVGQVGRSSGHAAHISGRPHVHPSHQTNILRNGSRSTGRAFAGTVVSGGSGPSSGIDTGIPNSSPQIISGGSHPVSWQNSGPSNNRIVPPPGSTLGGPVCAPLQNHVPRPLEEFSSPGFVLVPEASLHTNSSLPSGSSPFSCSSDRMPFESQAATPSSFPQVRTLVSSHEGSENLIAPSSSMRVESLSSLNSRSESVTGLFSTTAPAMSITTAVSSATVVEAIVVSISPILSPLRDDSANMEVLGDVFVQGGHSNFRSASLSDEVDDALMPLPSENLVSSTVETRARSETPAEVESEGLNASSHGHQRLVLSQPSTVGLSDNTRTAPVPIIYLSDDDE